MMPSHDHHAVARGRRVGRSVPPSRPLKNAHSTHPISPSVSFRDYLYVLSFDSLFPANHG